MPLNRPPKLQRQKAKGRAARAFVEFGIGGGKTVRRYCGVWGTDEAQQAYDRMIAEWLSNSRQLIEPPKDGLRIVELVNQCTRWVAANFPKGKTSRYWHYVGALRPLRDLYGDTLATEFGPLALEAIRDKLARDGKLSRTTINKRLDYVKRVFKWAKNKELIPPAVYDAIRDVEYLRKGEAREGEGVDPVPLEWVDAVKPHVAEPVKALIELQLLTGARPGELVGLRWTDLDRSDKDVWWYRPEHHKTAHLDHDRDLAFGPQAQEILKKFLTADRPINAPLFSPQDGAAERRSKRTRKTPLSCGNRPGTNRVRGRRKCEPGEAYTVDSYRRAIQRACEVAFPLPKKLRRANGESNREWRERLKPEEWRQVQAWRAEHRWHPHQLRHTSGTYVRREFGLEAAQQWLGHKSTSMTEVYAERDRQTVANIAKKIG
jgi:integrase